MFVCCKAGGWYHTDRLTGCIPLAISCGIPLIMDSTVAKVYGLHGLIYEKSVMEVIDHLSTHVHTPYATSDVDLDTMRHFLHDDMGA